MDLLSALSAIGDCAVIEGFEEVQQLGGNAEGAGTRESPRGSGELTGGESSHASTIAMLMKMGLVPGATVRLVAAGPGGDPLAVDVRGGRVALGRSEARLVRIRRTNAP